jgi:Skp family chaperone for outer membrane proteins
VIAVKKLIVCVTGFAALLTGALVTNHLFAQGSAAPAQPAGTKVAVINIGHVFNNYVRAKAFKEELERAFQPYKDKAKKLTDEMKRYEDEIRNPKISPQDIEQRQALIKRNKRELEDLSIEMQKNLGSKQEENLKTLWKEVNMGVTKVSEAYGFQIVLGYGEPLDKGLRDAFPNINRLMQAMDAGGAVPLYVHGSVDLSHAVTETLNRWVLGDQPKIQPTGGQK